MPLGAPAGDHRLQAWNRHHWPRQMKPHQPGENNRRKHSEKRQPEILLADHLVVDAEHISAKEALRLSNAVNYSLLQTVAHLLFPTQSLCLSRHVCLQPNVELVLRHHFEICPHAVVAQPAELRANNLIFSRLIAVK